MTHQYTNQTYNGFTESFTAHFNEFAIGAGELAAFYSWMLLAILIFGIIMGASIYFMEKYGEVVL